MLNNPGFYPTPEKLIEKMAAKIQGHPCKALDPSAGKGDLIKGINAVKSYGWHGQTIDFSAIEIDPDLQATLRGHSYKVIDTDFLDYTGTDQFDLIIANPPFADGEKHLLKAIDIMYRGQIVFLLNAETIRNPHTKLRKLLVRKLNELGATIEYIKNAFLVAERKTAVECALIYINIDRKVEDDLFADCKDKTKSKVHKITEKHEVSTGKTIEELVAEYNEVVKLGTDTIIAYYRNYRKVGKYIGLDREADKYESRTDDLTTKMQGKVNLLLTRVRNDFWRSTLNLSAVSSRLTSAKRKEFEHQLETRCSLDFTESNIRQFILNVIGGYEQTLIAAVLDTFDKFTKHSWRDNVREENIHYFNGWKTNSSFKVGKKVIVPMYGFWDTFGDKKWHKWKLSYDTAQQLEDIDKVCNYFGGMEAYRSIARSLENAFSYDPTGSRMSNIDSTYFKITVHKKGTLHLTFKDENILRRFNIVACRGKGWLPEDYGVKRYNSCASDEQQVVDSFEGKESYIKNFGKQLFATAPNIQIAYKEAA